MTFTAEKLKSFFHNVAITMEENKELLSELDRKLGDGDHGVTMSLGWQAVNEKITGDLKNETDCGKICITIGKTFLSAVGSTVGPLYATGLLRGGGVLQNKSELTDTDLIDFWIYFVNGIKERGNAKVGDKTMIDTFEPAIETLKNNFERTGDFIKAFTAAVEAGKKGMESTKDLVSTQGRSSRLGKRSIGNQDPGATSAYLILSSFSSIIQSLNSI